MILIIQFEIYQSTRRLETKFSAFCQCMHSRISWCSVACLRNVELNNFKLNVIFEFYVNLNVNGIQTDRSGLHLVISNHRQEERFRLSSDFLSPLIWRRRQPENGIDAKRYRLKSDVAIVMRTNLRYLQAKTVTGVPTTCSTDTPFSIFSWFFHLLLLLHSLFRRSFPSVIDFCI